jgi:Lectin C-type domain
MVVACLALLFAVWVGRASASDSAVLTWSGSGHHYQFIDTALNWPAAEALAESRGGYLLAVTTAEEQAWVNTNLVFPNQRYIWLGLVQDTVPTPGAWGPADHWHWITGEPVSYVDWYGPEPNDYPTPIEDNEENFAMIYSVLGQWQDGPSSGAPQGTCPIIEWPDAVLTWVGTPGYQSDGVDPNSGNPASSASPTDFTFRVQYIDPTGAPPTSADCVLEYKRAAVWHSWWTLPMTLESGDPATGAVYACSTQLPDEVLRYRFDFRSTTGTLVTGYPPCQWSPGPRIVGPPKLYWSKRAGYGIDGVKPNSGPVGTTFTFEVLYQDSHGDPPTTAQVLLRRNGTDIREKAMVALPDGGFRQGRLFSTSLVIRRSGTYEYRFEFADVSGLASGRPTLWTAGPTITGSAAALTVSALAASPEGVGAQVVFSLSAPGELEARVLNLAGRPVRTLCYARSCEAGANTLFWDARNSTGLRVPAGSYLIEVTARAPNGTQAHCLAAVQVKH